MGGGQVLSSPGSCLENFSYNPYIECTAEGTCHYYSEKMMYWMLAFDKVSVGQDRHITVMKRENVTDKVSRCRVCQLDPVAECRSQMGPQPVRIEGL